MRFLFGFLFVSFCLLIHFYAIPYSDDLAWYAKIYSVLSLYLVPAAVGVYFIFLSLVFLKKLINKRKAIFSCESRLILNGYLYELESFIKNSAPGAEFVKLEKKKPVYFFVDIDERLFQLYAARRKYSANYKAIDGLGKIFFLGDFFVLILDPEFVDSGFLGLLYHQINSKSRIACCVEKVVLFVDVIDLLDVNEKSGADKIRDKYNKSMSIFDLSGFDGVVQLAVYGIDSICGFDEISALWEEGHLGSKHYLFESFLNPLRSDINSSAILTGEQELNPCDLILNDSVVKGVSLVNLFFNLAVVSSRLKDILDNRGSLKQEVYYLPCFTESGIRYGFCSFDKKWHTVNCQFNQEKDKYGFAQELPEYFFRGLKEHSGEARSLKPLLYTRSRSLLLISVLSLCFSFFASAHYFVFYYSSLVRSVEDIKVVYDRINEDESSILEKIGHIIDMYHNYVAISELKPISVRVGLRVNPNLEGGIGDVGHLLSVIYDDELVDYFLYLIGEDLIRINSEWQLMSSTERMSIRDEYYNLLKAYLMLTIESDKRENYFLADIISSRMINQFNSIGYVTDMGALHTVVEALLQNALHYSSIMPESEEFISQARANLSVNSTADEIYNFILARNQARLPLYRVSSLIPIEYGSTVFSDYRFNSIYTSESWSNVFLPHLHDLIRQFSQEGWVLESHIDSIIEQDEFTLEERVTALYVNDYVSHWSLFLSGLALRDFSTIDEAAFSIRLNDNNDSFIQQLLEGVQRELSWIDRLHKENPKINDLTRYSFTDLSGLYSLIETQYILEESELYQYYDIVLSLGNELESLLLSSRVNNEALKYVGDILTGTGENRQIFNLNLSMQRIMQQSGSSNKVVESILSIPIDAVWRSLILAAENEVEEVWQATVYEYYTRNVLGYFPFSESGEDLSFSDLFYFLNQREGVFWRFYSDYVEPFVSENPSGLTIKSWHGLGLEYSDDYLQLVSRTRVISRIFDGSAQTGMIINYGVLPVPMQGIVETRFIHDDTSVTYRNQRQSWSSAQWLVGQQSSTARIQARPSGHSAVVNHHRNGGWSLLRLIRDAEARRISRNEYELTWTIYNRNGEALEVRFRIRADGAHILFQPEVLGSYGLPRNIFR